MEYIAQVFSDSVKMWSIEQYHHTHTYMSPEAAFEKLFKLQRFNTENLKPVDTIEFKESINRWIDIPWFDDILAKILVDSMSKNDRFDADVEILLTRDDGLSLGLIQSMDISIDSIAVYNAGEEEDYNMSDYMDYSSCTDYYPKICLISEERLCKRGFNPYHEHEGVLSFNFYKKTDTSDCPSYHYWEE